MPCSEWLFRVVCSEGGQDLRWQMSVASRGQESEEHLLKSHVRNPLGPGPERNGPFESVDPRLKKTFEIYSCGVLALPYDLFDRLAAHHHCL